MQAYCQRHDTRPRPHAMGTISPTGACQQDRWQGCQQMKRRGYHVHVLAKTHAFQDRQEIQAAFAHIGIPLTLVPHPRSLWPILCRRDGAALRSPALLDGAALEYLDPVYEHAVRQTIESFRPDVVWLEYTTHWPVLRLLRRYGVPCIMKSSLNEPQNCMDEHGRSIVSRFKACPKYIGEWIAARSSDMVLAITPDEERWYRSLGARHTGVLPLRGLSSCFTHREHAEKDILDVIFLSSNYNMGHNRDALMFLLQEIIPRLAERHPGKFRFHLTGKKFPSSVLPLLPSNVRATGFVEDLGNFLATMDIAVCPWIRGAGMQQKVFEPLCRCLPLLTSKVAGYPFVHNEDLLLCQTPDAYVDGLMQLTNAQERSRLSHAAETKARTLFSEDAVAGVMERAIKSVIR